MLRKNQHGFDTYNYELWLWSMKDQVSKVLRSFDSLISSLMLIGQEGGWGGIK